MSFLRWIGQALGIRGDLLVNGNIRTRPGTTGGGDVFTNDVNLSPGGDVRFTDAAGDPVAGIGLIGPIFYIYIGETTVLSITMDTATGDVGIPVLTSTTQAPGDNSTHVATTAYVDAAVAGGAPRLVIPLFSGNASTKFGSAQKLVLGSQYFDPSDPAHGLGGSSTATLCMLLESTSGSVNAQGELFQKSGTGSPQVIAATSTTAATTATLVTADVSAAFTDTSPAGIFCARLWTGTPNGVNQATCTGAWIEVTA